ncbi:MAG: hypothetical protein ACYTDY_16370 [Planctomycetota bacterium]
MEPRIRTVEYFYTTVRDTPGEGYRVLAHLASVEVNLLAFNAIPMGPVYTRLTLFPDSMEKLAGAAEKMGLVLEGPHRAILVQGDDALGALVDIHLKLYDAGVNVFASNGVTDGRGSYGYVLFIRPEEYEGAVWALGV